MSEDVSAQIRTGITIIVVAALLAVIINLMVIAQSIISSGMGTLQTGIDKIQLQEFEQFNQATVTGVQVKTAINLYTARDIGIVLRTTNAQKAGKAYCYGVLLEGGSNKPSESTDTQTAQKVFTLNDSLFTGSALRAAGQAYYTMEYSLTAYNQLQYNLKMKGITSSGNDQFIRDAGRFQAELIQNSTGSIIGLVFTQID